MNEIKRTIRLFDDLFNGNPWLDVTLLGTLGNISASRAAAKKNPERNSIWEIANHLINWRRNVLERVNGKIIVTPEHNYFLPVADVSEKAWKSTLSELESTEKEWIGFLENFKPSDFEQTYPPNGHTHYEHIHGIIQHDAYHLGQIVLLAKHG